MSVIVAVIGRSSGAIASDSLETSTDGTKAEGAPKFVRRGRAFIAFAGECKHEVRIFEPPLPLFRGGDPDAFVRRFRSHVRARCPRGYGASEMMLVLGGGLWHLDAYGVTTLVAGDCFAIGDGAPAARAVALDLRGRVSPAERARRAVAAASLVFTSCGGGVHLARFQVRG